ALQREILPVNLDNATAQNYKDFTKRAQQVLTVFFQCAINHYAECYELGNILVLFVFKQNFANTLVAKEKNFTREQCIAICAQVFNNGCGEYFLRQVNIAWQCMDDATLLGLSNLAKTNMEEYQIPKLFCDEVHSLQDMFVGMFCHSGYPTTASNTPWTDVRGCFFLVDLQY
ncbi:hypothetical protein HW132_35650, partial [Brasilonema sp. CT11]|nr:hypothetical protein [Brasilonema sp. CT11]